MVDVYKPPFGTYTSVQAIAAPLEAEIKANLASFALLFGIVLAADAVTYNASAAVPDFQKISDGMRRKLGDEIKAMSIAITAMP